MPTGAAGPNSHRVLPVLDSVVAIATPSVPSEIVHVIIGGVAVIVATLHPLWAWADKSFENQAVDASFPSAGPQAQIYPQMPALGRLRLDGPSVEGSSDTVLELDSSVHATNPAVGTDLV